jgi:hypothetical protein
VWGVLLVRGRDTGPPPVDSVLMELPPADPAALLNAWMEWERGDVAPGRTLSDLKRAGLRGVLEELVLTQAELAESGSGLAGSETEQV